MQKLCLSAKFSHQEIRWNYGIFRSDSSMVKVNITPHFSTGQNLLKKTLRKDKFWQKPLKKNWEKINIGKNYWKKNYLKMMKNAFYFTLKVVSATFLLVCFVCIKESTFETKKNVFYFTSKALFVLQIIRF